VCVAVHMWNVYQLKLTNAACEQAVNQTVSSIYTNIYKTEVLLLYYYQFFAALGFGMSIACIN